jgi:hypothetical protein
MLEAIGAGHNDKLASSSIALTNGEEAKLDDNDGETCSSLNYSIGRSLQSAAKISESGRKAISRTPTLSASLG